MILVLTHCRATKAFAAHIYKVRMCQNLDLLPRLARQHGVIIRGFYACAISSKFTCAAGLNISYPSFL